MSIEATSSTGANIVALLFNDVGALKSYIAESKFGDIGFNVTLGFDLAIGDTVYIRQVKDTFEIRDNPQSDFYVDGHKIQIRNILSAETHIA